MTVTEYLIELEEQLKFLPKKKRDSIMHVYREKINNMIDYGEDEEKITASLPSPNEIAANLYESEGINYLDKRKKKAKQTDIIKAIISGILIVLLVSATIVLTVVTFSSVVNVIKLLLKLKGLLEIVITSILVLSYALALILIYIYILDLFHILFNMLLENVLVPFNKTYKFVDITLMDYVNKLFKKPKVFGKVLGITCLVLLLFIGIGYFTKTYVYRSMNVLKPVEHVENINLEEYDKVQKLLLDIDSANIIITNGDKLQITVSSEFERNNEIQVIDETIKFNTDSLKEFDLLGLLTEPIPYVEITIPETFDLTLELDSGLIQMEKVQLNNLKIAQKRGNVIALDTAVYDLKCSMESGGINLTNVSFNNLNIESDAGSVLLDTIKGSQVDYVNGSAKVDIKNFIVSHLNMINNTGHVFVNDLVANDTAFEVTNCTLDLKKMKVEQFINIKSIYKSNVTLYEAVTKQVDVVMNGGTFTGYYLEMDGKIQTTGNALLSYITGNFEVEAYGRHCEIYELIGDILSVKTQSTETTLKYIKANSITYNAYNSTSLLYLVFGKDMIVRDSKGDIVFDNNKDISENEELYIKYYQKIERLDITSSASFNVDPDVKLGAWEWK